jgi:excisionase family DNA binding protein
MRKVFSTNLTEVELRTLIREEVRAALYPVNVPDEFIDISQAAEVLKLKRSYIYKLVNNKEIPFHKSGRKLLFKRSELLERVIKEK